MPILAVIGRQGANESERTSAQCTVCLNEHSKGILTVIFVHLWCSAVFSHCRKTSLKRQAISFYRLYPDAPFHKEGALFMMNVIKLTLLTTTLVIRAAVMK